MIDLSKYKIIKYAYPFSSDELGVMIWDKMNDQESKGAIQLTLKGVNDTGGTDTDSWDCFFLDDKLKNKIDEVLVKYNVPFEVEDETHLLLENIDLLPITLIEKLDKYLVENLSIDDVLDRISEVGLPNITTFERYFLDKHKDDEQD
jgi:hypothetical protein